MEGKGLATKWPALSAHALGLAMWPFFTLSFFDWNCGENSFVEEFRYIPHFSTFYRFSFSNPVDQPFNSLPNFETLWPSHRRAVRIGRARLLPPSLAPRSRGFTSGRPSLHVGCTRSSKSPADLCHLLPDFFFEFQNSMSGHRRLIGSHWRACLFLVDTAVFAQVA
jgi:hypothetical protein